MAQRQKKYKKSYVLTVTLNPSLDKTISVHNASAKDPFSEKKEVLSSGGKGLNVSRSLSRLNIPTLATGFVGGTTGSLIKKLLKDELIPNRFQAIKGETRTNLTLVHHDKSLSRFLEDGPAVVARDVNQFKRKLGPLLKKSIMAVFSGRNIPGASVNLYKELLGLCRKNHTVSVLDTYGEAFLSAVKANSFIIKLNLQEAQEALKTELNSFEKMKKGLKKFHRLGANIVLLSLAQEGVLGSSPFGAWKCSAPKIDKLNDVGCGDAMVAGFIYAFLKGYPFPFALKMATAAGTANAINYVPGDVNINDINRLIKSVKLSQVC